MTFEDMKKEIGVIDCLFNEVLSENETLEYFQKGAMLNIRYLFESLGNIDKELYQNYRDDIVQVFGELQYNSFMHGNKFNPDLPIYLQILKGENGYIFRIEDCGNGFDVKDRLVKMKNGEKYYNNGGCGFSEFENSKKCIISYEGKGNIANLMWKKDN